MELPYFGRLLLAEVGSTMLPAGRPLGLGREAEGQAAARPLQVLENVVFDEETRVVDFESK